MTAKPLWPQPLPVIGLTGEFFSGKTLFGLSICPAQTLVYDLEKSSESYQSLGFHRIDVAAEMTRLYPRGARPVDLWCWWRDHMRSVRPGQYRVIMVDPVSELESGLTEWVRQNAGHFGRTPGQYLKMSGLLWGDVKEHWKAILSDVASRCESFVFVSHMGTVWAGDKPTGKRKPKGKETLMELASLYLLMERKPDAKGVVPEKPAAVVLKSRLAYTSVDADGDVGIKPVLPPRLPVATPRAIREYCNRPADYAALASDERVYADRLSDDEKMQLRLATAEAEAEAIRLKVEMQDRRNPAPRIVHVETARNEIKQAAAPETPAAAPSASPAPEPTQTPVPAGHGNGRATGPQLETIRKYRDTLYDMDDVSEDDRAKYWAEAMAKRGVRSARELTEKQAAELISALAHRLNLADIGAGCAGEPTSEVYEEIREAGFRPPAA